MLLYSTNDNLTQEDNLQSVNSWCLFQLSFYSRDSYRNPTSSDRQTRTDQTTVAALQQTSVTISKHQLTFLFILTRFPFPSLITFPFAGAIFLPGQQELRAAFEHAIEVHNYRDQLFSVTPNVEVLESDDPFQVAKKSKSLEKVHIYLYTTESAAGRFCSTKQTQPSSVQPRGCSSLR